MNGLGTVAANAKRLSKEVMALDDGARPIVVLAYSKGLPHTLEMVVRYPEAARRIVAIVSVAQAVTPLAEDMEDVYRKIGAKFPMPGCDSGTGRSFATCVARPVGMFQDNVPRAAVEAAIEVVDANSERRRRRKAIRR